MLYLPHIFPSKYFSTLYNPQRPFTTGIVAGTGNSKSIPEASLFPSLHFHDKDCFRASLMAALVAQWTEAARSKGGSPEAVDQNQEVVKHESIDPQTI